MTSGKRLFEEAIAKFKQRLTVSEQQKFECPVTLIELKRDILSRECFPIVVPQYNSLIPCSGITLQLRRVLDSDLTKCLLMFLILLESLNTIRINNVRYSVQKHQEDRMESMGLHRIHKFLEGMEGLGKIIDVFLNTSGIVAFVWGPIKFLLQVKFRSRFAMRVA